MNEFEEIKFLQIKEELVNNEVEKRVGNYFLNRNELNRYYNVGKLLIEAQGGENRAKYGDGLIKKYSEKLTNEIGNGYSTRTLKLMRKFYLFQKGQPLVAQFKHVDNQKVSLAGSQLTWSHYIIL